MEPGQVGMGSAGLSAAPTRCSMGGNPARAKGEANWENWGLHIPTGPCTSSPILGDFPFPSLGCMEEEAVRKRKMPRDSQAGPPPWKNSDTGDKKSLEAARHLDQMLSDLERRREMGQRALLKAALPEGSNGFVPAPDTRREEMPDSATEDVITETGIFAPDPVRLPRIVCPQDVRRSCMIGTVVTLFTVPLVLIGCYLGIRKLYQSRRSVVDFSPQLSCNSAHSIGSLTRSHAALELWPVRGCPKNSAEGSAAAQCFHWPLHCWALSWGARWGCSQCWLPLRLPGQEQPRGHRAEAGQVLNSIWATQLRTGQCLFSSSLKVSW
ncbi:uncharacterized protein LOC128783183 isoform X2 [Vidua chalybeata]|uniref:uncharacterized protein LOC128783182 isoform X2 n=1 Tax=Vidua chalybeata TaxID=81927 RepID=UPI0023A7E7D2|nr:uncharacterized protein LOC128783182 isoform X2 [Vidua chalybeata]XP_053789781.1 uncharacterized protein LOC128783183 isoform X2 [Vidua chalybeata]